MFIKKNNIFININNFVSITVRPFSDSTNLEVAPKFIVKKVIKKIPVKVKLKVIKKIPKIVVSGSTQNVVKKVFNIEKSFKIKLIKKSIKDIKTVKKLLFLKEAPASLIPKIKKGVIKRKIFISKLKKLITREVGGVSSGKIFKHVKIVKKPKIKKKVLKKKLKVKKPKIKKPRLKKKKLKLIPLGPMPDFYKLKTTKRVSFIGISFRQNRRLVNKPWLKKKKWKKRGSRQKGKITVTFKVNNRKRLKNGRKISKRNYIEKWKYAFVRRDRNRNKKRIHLFYNRKRNNTFITLTDGRGRVLVSQSAGYCKIKSKKKKRSPDTLKAIAFSVAKAARSKNIRYIYKMYSKNRHMKSRRAIFNEFRRAGLMILVNVIVKRRPHSLSNRRKKVKRL